MIPALSQVCTLNAPLVRDVEDFAAGHCRAIELWMTKLETYLESHSADDFRRLLAEQDVTAPVASFQGGLLDSQGEARRQHWDHFQRRLALCRELEIVTLVVAADVAGPLSQPDLDRVAASLAEAAGRAGQHGVRLALEPQARSAFCNNLQTAAALVAQTASPQLGICLDAMHYYTGPSKPEDLRHLTADNLFHVQLCDLAGTPRELATDSDRVLPGDGDFDLAHLVEHLRRIEYAGCVSVELMNPRMFPIPPRQFGEIAITALRRVLGLAEMG